MALESNTAPQGASPDQQELIPKEESGPAPIIVVGTYAKKHILALGMLNACLLLSNAADLKNLFEFSFKARDGFWFAALVLIGISILLQIVISVLFVLLGFSKMETASPHTLLCINRKNTACVFIILIITVVNVFIGGFNIHVNMK